MTENISEEKSAYPDSPSISAQGSGKLMSCGSLTNIPAASPVPVNFGLLRPIRSIEGLNQEIEKLVLHPGMAGRANRLDQVSALRDTPEGNESPLQHEGARSTQTPVQHFSHLHSQSGEEDSHDSLSPTDVENPLDELAHGGHSRSSFARIGSAEASPRINKFMAQLPPEGCERVPLTRTAAAAADESSAKLTNVTIIKPVAGFQLRPSQGSAFRVASTANLIAQGTETIQEIPAEGADTLVGDGKDVERGDEITE